MDGLELARAIQNDPQLTGTPLVMLTSLGMRSEAEELQQAGIAICLTKPIKQSQLFDCLMSVVANNPNRRAAVEPSPVPARFVPTQELPEPSEPKRKRVSILVAEDNVINQKVALLQLRKIGYAADAVANGREALEALSRIPYDLILMDCQMPEMDGYEATAAIRRWEGARRHTPIIAMTANALEGDKEKCLSAGMDDYVRKPVNIDELRGALERWLPAKVLKDSNDQD
jgi:CheY-like chemotaxis protein